MPQVNSFRLLAAIVACLPMCQSAWAHNLFVLTEPGPGDQVTVNVIFEHAPKPGGGGYNQPLLDRGETWVRAEASEETANLELTEVARKGKKFLQTQVASGGPRAIVHSCPWGIYHGRLDYFHGKYLEIETAEQLQSLGKEPQLPLDLIPSPRADGIVLTVRFQGEPVVNGTVWVWGPDGKSKKKTTDAAGEVAFEDLVPGTYSFATVHILNQPTGKFQGESYRGIMHGTTCTLKWPLR